MLRVLAALPVAIWSYLIALRGEYWRTRTQVLPPQQGPIPSARIVAVIPARNESDVIGEALESLLDQHLATPLEIVLVDDGSEDGTADVARVLADRRQATDRITIIQGSPLPEGWTGKLWAVAQGVREAERLSPDYLLLTDADISHAPDAIGRILQQAVRNQYGLTSLMVRLATDTLAEKILIPAFVYFFFQLYPPKWVARPGLRTAAAAGGCMLIRFDVLRSIGGIDSVANEVIDDCALAARVKRGGYNTWLGLADQSRSLRSYGGWSGVGQMISRSAFNQLRHSGVLLVLTVAGLAITYVLPFALLFRRRERRLGATAMALMLCSYQPIVRFYWQSWTVTLLLPFVALFYGGATVHSAIRYWSGQGGLWKGRVQDRP